MKYLINSGCYLTSIIALISVITLAPITVKAYYVEESYGDKADNVRAHEVIVDHLTIQDFGKEKKWAVKVITADPIEESVICTKHFDGGYEGNPEFGRLPLGIDRISRLTFTPEGEIINNIIVQFRDNQAEGWTEGGISGKIEIVIRHIDSGVVHAGVTVKLVR